MQISPQSIPLGGPHSIPPKATHLLICLHGFGADGNDLFGLASPLQAALAAHGVVLAVACPHAPQPTPFGQGRQWFSDKSWTFRDREGIATAQRLLWNYLEELHNQTQIPYTHMVIMGFSQGAMTAIYSAPRWPQAVGGVISVAGLAMWQEELDETTCEKPPFLFVHGLEDDVVPADASIAADSGLKQLGFKTTLHLQPNLGHGIDAATLAEVVVWLQELWATPTAQR
jgi:phospholipase/carboxylesterase